MDGDDMAHGRIDQHERRVVELIKQKRQLQVRKVGQHIVCVDVTDGQSAGQGRESDRSEQPVLPPALQSRKLSAPEEWQREEMPTGGLMAHARCGL